MTTARIIDIRSSFSTLLVAMIVMLSFAIGFGLGGQDEHGSTSFERVASTPAEEGPASPQAGPMADVATAVDRPVYLAASEQPTPVPAAPLAVAPRAGAEPVHAAVAMVKAPVAAVPIHDVVAAPVQEIAYRDPAQPEVVQPVRSPLSVQQANAPVAPVEIRPASFQPEIDPSALLTGGHTLSDQELAAVSPDPYGGVKAIALADPIS